MAYSSLLYIPDGVIHTHYAFTGTGRHMAVADFWAAWHTKIPLLLKKNPELTIMSYNEETGYEVNKVIDTRACGLQRETVSISTEGALRVSGTPSSSILTDRGMVKVSSIGIGIKLKVVDNYKGFYGDTISLQTTIGARMIALLRTHDIEYESVHYNAIRIKGVTITGVEFDLDHPIVEGSEVTVGPNNYRQFIKEMLDLPDYTFRTVTGIKLAKNKGHGVALYLRGTQNVVLQNGIIVQSTQTKVRPRDR
jgi:uncharacterized protein YjeT (DUF2065 family)